MLAMNVRSGFNLISSTMDIIPTFLVLRCKAVFCEIIAYREL